MLVKTRIFEFRNNSYRNLTELAQAMGISISQIGRVREDTRGINLEIHCWGNKSPPQLQA